MKLSQSKLVMLTSLSVPPEDIPLSSLLLPTTWTPPIWINNPRYRHIGNNKKHTTKTFRKRKRKLQRIARRNNRK